jgi:voltage-gated potassium channel
MQEAAKAPRPAPRLRRRVHDILEGGALADPTARAVNIFLIALIVLNVVAFAAETVPEVAAAYGPWLETFEWISVAIFTVEYALRIWSSVEVPLRMHTAPWRERLHFAMRPLQLIDLVAILPAYLSMFVPIDLRVLRVLRLLRFFKLARYSSALTSLGRAIAAERRALAAALMIMVSLVLFAATGMYFIERDVQPYVFGTVPDAMWWAVVTLATVGYGDVVPMTMLGKMFTTVVIFMGLGVFALPIGIIATGFSQEVTRRDFVVTWSLVARVPLFAGLDAASLAEIMTLLYSRIYPEGAPICRIGDPADAMFFIATGEVVVHSDDGPVRLGDGEFFGEMALIDRRAHAHQVNAVTRCRILLLDREDFERLCRRHPDIHERIAAKIEQRRAPRERT